MCDTDEASNFINVKSDWEIKEFGKRKILSTRGRKKLKINSASIACFIDLCAVAVGLMTFSATDERSEQAIFDS